LENKRAAKDHDERELICLRLSRAVDETDILLSRAMETELDENASDLNQPKLKTLHYVIESGSDGISLAGLASSCLREMNTMSAIIRKLEKDGIIARIPGRGREKFRFTATTKGHDIYYNRVTNYAVKAFFDVLTDQEKEEYLRLSRKLIFNAKDMLGIGFKPKFLLTENDSSQ
jgi:DNA-binding MarR family transcriptional regulator